jgi:hypothetical protein
MMPTLVLSQLASLFSINKIIIIIIKKNRYYYCGADRSSDNYSVIVKENNEPNDAKLLMYFLPYYLIMVF